MAWGPGRILFRRALPQSIAGRLLCTLQAWIIKIGAKAVGNVLYTCFLGDEVSLRRNLAATIPRRMQTLMRRHPCEDNQSWILPQFHGM